MKQRWRVWAGFAGLCLLSGSGWVEDQFWTSPLPPLLRIALHDALLAAVFGVVAWVVWRRCGSRLELKPIGAIAGWGTVLLASPAVVYAASGGLVEQATVALVYTMVPVFIVFAGAQASTGFGASAGEFPALLPALAGVGGAALLLEFRLPPSLLGRVWLAVFVGVAGFTGVAAIRLHGLLRDASLPRAATAIAGGTALVSGIAAWIGRLDAPTMTAPDLLLESATGLLIAGPILLLTVWLLREMAPVAFSARYLLIPLVTIVGGYLMLRPDASWTTPAAVLLLGCGGWRLLAPLD